MAGEKKLFKDSKAFVYASWIFFFFSSQQKESLTTLQACCGNKQLHNREMKRGGAEKHK